MTDFATVRARIGGLKGLISKLGDQPPDHKWNGFPKCPFCGHKDSASVFKSGDAEFFKCHFSRCSSGGRCVAEVGYISLRLGLSDERPQDGGPSPAYTHLLILAGCYEPPKPPGPPPPPQGALPSGSAASIPNSPALGSEGTQDSVAAAGLAFGQGSKDAKDVGSTRDTRETKEPKGARDVRDARNGRDVRDMADGGDGPVLDPGYGALRWFFERLTPTNCQMQAYLPGDEPVPTTLPEGMMKKLRFRPVSLLEKRGLTPESCAALGFRANPRANKDVLLEMRNVFDWEERLASGLWLEADRKRKQDRRPNTQFCGKGQVGKKPEKSRRNEDDKWQWGWSEPVLIPYFNELGELVKLRPHKGGAAGGTAAGSERVYVPRDFASVADSVEKFSTVIICEGEFKAAVIWQEIGAGAALNYDDMQSPVGVCALPGISFAKNFKYRADLEDWLQLVGCKRVIVAFDDEDKRHKPMCQRFDAVKYARYLAQDLIAKLGINGLFVKLPEEWRTHGKADWDGAMVKLLKGEILS